MRTSLVAEKLRKMAETCKVIKKEEIKEVFDLIVDSHALRRKQLISSFEFPESSLTKYLARLEFVDLIKKSKKGRESTVGITQYGRKISEAIGHPIPLKIPYILSDINRICILEVIVENGGTNYNELFWNTNYLLKKYSISLVNPDNFKYHIDVLKRNTQIIHKKTYVLTKEGKKTAKVIENLVGYLMF